MLQTKILMEYDPVRPSVAKKQNTCGRAWETGGGIAATFVKPHCLKLIGEEHYDVMVDGSAYLMLDGISGRGNYSISCPAGRIAEVGRTDKHLRRSSYLIKVEGTVNMPIALESRVLAGTYTGWRQTC